MDNSVYNNSDRRLLSVPDRALSDKRFGVDMRNRNPVTFFFTIQCPQAFNTCMHTCDDFMTYNFGLLLTSIPRPEFTPRLISKKS